ncbi:MAG: DUF4412 domain-containing protein [Deltaproteobacteria bacterium]|nr:DUF4412 domain-containing protein [Deltaproteobacteria bacterium]
MSDSKIAHRMARFLGTVLCLLFALAPSTASAAKISSFSAEQIHINSKGVEEGLQKFYVTPDKMRMEGAVQMGKGTMTMIYRKDKKIIWMINPGKKLYYEKPFDEAEWGKMFKDVATQNVVKELGTETVNGYKCEKKLVAATVEFLGFKKKSESTIWVAKEFDLPMRTKHEDGSMTELRKIKTGSQPKALFELPAGYAAAPNMFAILDEPEENKQEGGDKGPMPSLQDIKDKLKGLKLPFGDKN